MPIQISNQATLTYRYGLNTGSAASNIATATLQGPLSIEKTSLDASYRAGTELTYILMIANNGSMPLSNASIADDLGTFSLPGPVDVRPLSYIGPARLYVNGAFQAELAPETASESVTFALPELPANAVAMLIYKVRVNEYAPLWEGSTIVNNAVGTAVGLCEPAVSSYAITIDSYADVRILKTMSPDPVTDGNTLTYAFNIYNYGNVGAEEIVLRDAFAPAPLTVAVTVDGVPVGSSQFSYLEGVFRLPRADGGAAYAVPAATFTQDPQTGFITVNPGHMLVTVSGII